MQTQDTQERLQQEEDARNQLFQNKKKLEQEASGLKKDIEDLELALQKTEQDKATKDHQIRNLNDEIAHQDELINKLNKEKKHMQEVNQKTAEDLQASEDKVNHLNKVKAKLEQTLDELEDSLEREKKLRYRNLSFLSTDWTSQLITFFVYFAAPTLRRTSARLRVT